MPHQFPQGHPIRPVQCLEQVSIQHAKSPLQGSTSKLSCLFSEEELYQPRFPQQIRHSKLPYGSSRHCVCLARILPPCISWLYVPPQHGRIGNTEWAETL